MKWTKGYYTDNNGNLYYLKEKVSTGFIFGSANGFTAKVS